MRVDPRNRVALITGASSGIGEAMSREFAARGANLILVARRGEVLQGLAQRLSSEFGVRVQTVVADLSKPGASRALFEATEGSGERVDFLVNNAGVGRVKLLSGDDPEAVRSMLELNTQALTELTILFLGPMRARAFGGILQVSSMLALIPLPGMSVYAASKAYVSAMSRALQVELRGSGVWVSVLCPGTVPSGFQAAAGFGQQHIPVPGELSAGRVAKIACEGFLRRRQVIFPGLLNRLSAVVLPHVPRNWLARMAFASLKRLGRFG